MLIYVKENMGVIEALVDRKVEDGKEIIYIPYWATKNVYGAVNDGEERGYTACGAKLCYIQHETYKRLKEDLINYLKEVDEIKNRLLGLNRLNAPEMTLGEFMAYNAVALQNSGNAYMTIHPETGEGIVIDEPTACRLRKQWLAEHTDEPIPDEDEDDYDDYDDDEDDEDEDDEPEIGVEDPIKDFEEYLNNLLRRK